MIITRFQRTSSTRAANWKDELSRVVSPMPNDRVLLLGDVPGRLIASCSHRAAMVSVGHHSQNQINRFHRKLSSIINKFGVTFVRTQYEKMPWMTETYETICLGPIETENIRSVLDECARLLSPGGRIIWFCSEEQDELMNHYEDLSACGFTDVRSLEMPAWGGPTHKLWRALKLN